MKNKRSSARSLAASFIIISSLATGVNAAVITENLNVTNLSGGTNDYGQSITISAGSAWNNLTFNFWSAPGNPASAPFADGTLFLLEAEYLGAQGALSPATPGFIAQTSTISGGTWVFAPDVTVNPSTQYWIYTQGATIDPVAFGSSYSGGIGYQDTGGGYIAVPSADLGFSFSGTAVPEPSSALLIALGALGMVHRRRNS